VELDGSAGHHRRQAAGEDSALVRGVIFQEGDGAAGRWQPCPAKTAVELMREISRRDVPAAAEGGVGELLLVAAHRDGEQ
jgi:hypothetical protein